MTRSSNDPIPQAISVSQMAKLLQISRSRFYQLLDAGFFLPPIYDIRTKRPFYSQDMIEKNVQAKSQNLGVNGEVILFYSPRTNILPKPKRAHSTVEMVSNSCPVDVELLESLRALGLENLTEQQVQSALKSCYPNGVDQEEDEVLRKIFRHLKCQNSGDNLRR